MLAHGAGAGMTHPFIAGIADRLADRGIASLRYQFPYMEQASKRPDTPKLAQATVRAAVAEPAEARAQIPDHCRRQVVWRTHDLAGEAESPLPGVRGLAFLGFPLQASGRPSVERAAHLSEVKIPMLFLQGTRDALADAALMRKLARGLGKRATLVSIEEGDHSLHVPARNGRNDATVRVEMLDALTGTVI
jgi:predicted alpha/beta-hydrolase family hydrolase